jgi:hypothetical protein
MCVDNPRQGFGELFDTHPSVENRVAALVKYAAGTIPARSSCRQWPIRLMPIPVTRRRKDHGRSRNRAAGKARRPAPARQMLGKMALKIVPQVVLGVRWPALHRIGRKPGLRPNQHRGRGGHPTLADLLARCDPHRKNATSKKRRDFEP